MPLARLAPSESDVEIYVASTADDGIGGRRRSSHIARESGAFVVPPAHCQHASACPDDFPLRDLLAGHDVIGRGGSVTLAPDGWYLAGPLYGEEGILYAALDPTASAGAAARRPGRSLPPTRRPPPRSHTDQENRSRARID